MTSPARWIETVSPTRTSLRAISSSLCSVALVTTTPPTVTGLEIGDGRERARAADIDVDAVDDRDRLLGRELVRQRPARRARHEAEPVLQVEVVELVDDAVDVIAELGALRLDEAVLRQHLVEAPAQPHERIGLEAEALERRDDAHLGPGRHRAHLAPGIGEEAQRARRP